MTARRTLHNQNNSPLLKLPAELRNKIYHYVFSGHVISISQRYWAAKHTCVYLKEDCLNKEARSQAEFLALTATCRQIHHETYLFPFALSELRLNAYLNLDFRVIQIFLDSLSAEKRAAITKLSVPDNFYVSFLLAYFSGQDFPTDSSPEFDVQASEQEMAGPFRTLLAQLNGLKCILVLRTTYLSSDADEKAVATSVERTRQECGRVDQWVQPLLDEGEVEVMVEL